MIVVSDTGPLISLMKAGQLELLQKLYQEILIPEAVYQELTSNRRYENETAVIQGCDYIRTVPVRDRRVVELLQKLSGLDLGESQAIACAGEHKADILLMEEAAGRRVAKSLGIHVRGSLGILLLGFDRKLLTAEDVEQATARMRSANRRISGQLYQYVLDYIRKPVESSYGLPLPE